jgi:hypothetical protein
MLAISFGWLVHQEAFASVEQIRNFYGVVKVVRTFDHGQAKLSMTQAGAEQGEQFEAIERRSEVTCGMEPGRGLGLALTHHAKRRADGPTAPLRIGIIGLGAGMAAGLGRPGDSIAYYEVNPAVYDLARRRFTFLRDSKAAITVSIGDGRLALERELQALGPRQFDVLVLDAFRGTSPPLHLMTREAFSTYLAHLAEDGTLAVNIEFDTFNVAPLYRASRRPWVSSSAGFRPRARTTTAITQLTGPCLRRTPGSFDRLLSSAPFHAGRTAIAPNSCGPMPTATCSASLSGAGTKIVRWWVPS